MIDLIRHLTFARVPEACIACSPDVFVAFSDCPNFLDYFEDFNNNVVKNGYDAVYEKFYINNDVHFNKKGNILIADKIIKTFLDN